MTPSISRRRNSDDTQNTVLDAVFVGELPDASSSIHSALTVFVASVSLLFILLLAVAILHFIVRRRQRQISSNWPSNRTLCLITPQSTKGPEQAYVLELAPASAKDVERALQSLGPFPANEKVDPPS